MKGWTIINLFYILRVGMYKLMRKKRLLSLGIVWKLLIITGGSFSGKWYKIML